MGDSPSINHSSAALRLGSKGVAFDSNKDARGNPPDLNTIVQRLRQGMPYHEFQRQQTVTDDSVQSLVECLSNSYPGEIEFDIELFKTLKNLFSGDFERVENDHYFVLAQRGLYAFGFARHLGGKKLPQVATKTNARKGKASPVDDYDSTAHSESDHAACIFERSNDGSEWKPIKVLAVVELKMDNTSSRLHDGNKSEMFLRYNNDAIFQPASYVLETIWPDICGLGLGQKASALPVVIIAARRKETLPSKKRAQWLRTHLLVPTLCGEEFKIRFGSSGFFIPDEPKHKAGAETAASLYIETLLFGIQMWNLWQTNFNSDIIPSPLSGLKISVDKSLSNAALCGSPLVRGRSDFFNVTQGEIFRLKLDEAKEYLQAFETWTYDQRSCLRDPDPNLNILVKVCSLTVHDHIQAPHKVTTALSAILLAFKDQMIAFKDQMSALERQMSAFKDQMIAFKDQMSALERQMSAFKDQMIAFKDQMLRLKMQLLTMNDQHDKNQITEQDGQLNGEMRAPQYEGIQSKIAGVQSNIGRVQVEIDALALEKREVEKKEVPVKTCVQEMSKVLVAVRSTDISLISVMIEQRCCPVCAESGNAVELWSQFVVLVNIILKPLADLHVVHTDIRPGYDTTANVVLVGKGEASNVMRLIDYDSLAMVEAYIWPCIDARYPKEKKDAVRFLKMQCIGVADAWLHKTKCADFKMPKALERHHHLLDKSLDEVLTDLEVKLKEQASSA